MGEAMIFYADGTYKRLSGAPGLPTEGKWNGCDVCQKPQPMDGGIADDLNFTCAGCLGK
jgi:hypothetical protein